VVAAGLISVLPLRGQQWMDVATVEGDTRPLGERPVVPYRPVSPHYFRAMGIAIRSGRVMAETDLPRRVVVVSESAARLLWPGDDPIGKRFRRGDPTEAYFEVLGVVADVHSAGIERAPEPTIYVPLWERAPPTAAIAIRTTADPYAAAGALRDAVRSLDRDVPVSALQSMARIEEDALAEPRFQTLLVSGFAGSALLLAFLGTYAALGYSVARRTGEIGIRMALGARPGEVFTMLLRQGLKPVVPGLSLGLLLALAIGRAISGLLYSVSGSDGPTFAAVALVTLVCAAVACIVPALRASRAQPLSALHHD
jgi:putative ABC transport system permease protein